MKGKILLFIGMAVAMISLNAMRCFAQSEYTPGENYLLVYHKTEFPERENTSTPTRFEYNYLYETNEGMLGGIKSLFVKETCVCLKSLLMLRFIDDSSVGVYLYTYESDSNGKIQRENCYDAGTFSSYVLYEYDSDGNLTLKNTYVADNNKYAEVLYEYDQAGNRTKWTSTQLKNTLFTYEFE